MGAFLDKPATEKTTHVFSSRKEEFLVASSEMQGWRIDMEDAHAVEVRVPDYDELAWFAVFDGHGGSLVSRTSAQILLDHVTSHEEFRASRTVSSISSALKSSFLAVDRKLRDLGPVRTGEDHSGSTAIAVMLTPTHFIVANCGDSRAILVRKSGVVELSWDHKPFNEGEQKRIEAAGGTVSMRRVNGDLAVSRALGDFVYKQASTLPDEEQQVTAAPEIHVEPRDPEEDQYLVLACDGIWDVFENAELGEWIKQTVAKGCPTLEELCEEILDEGLKRNSRDNMSVLMVKFPSASEPPGHLVSTWAVEKAGRKRVGGGE